MEEPTRRAVVVGGMAAGASVLVGCSGGSGTSAGGGGGGSSSPLVSVSDVPVGGAVAAKDASGPIIVAQPTAGKVVAFSAICTHMGCQVAPAGAKLNCPCHGSQYNALTGEVLRGPAPKPLPPVAVHVQNGQVLPGSG